MKDLLESRVKAVSDKARQQQRETDAANAEVVAGRREKLAARDRALHFPERTPKEMTIPAYERAIITFARIQGYPEREVYTRDIKLRDIGDMPRSRVPLYRPG